MAWAPPTREPSQGAASTELSGYPFEEAIERAPAEGYIRVDLDDYALPRLWPGPV